MIFITEERRSCGCCLCLRLSSALRSAFLAYGKGEAQNQPRRRLILPTGSMLHSMAASYGNYFGTKVYSTNLKHGAHFTFLLYDADTAKPLAQFEANYLGQIRTGAASGLAADLACSRQASRCRVDRKWLPGAQPTGRYCGRPTDRKSACLEPHGGEARSIRGRSQARWATVGGQSLRGSGRNYYRHVFERPVIPSRRSSEDALILAMGANVSKPAGDSSGSSRTGANRCR